MLSLHGCVPLLTQVTSDQNTCMHFLNYPNRLSCHPASENQREKDDMHSVFWASARHHTHYRPLHSTHTYIHTYISPQLLIHLYLTVSCNNHGATARHAARRACTSSCDAMRSEQHIAGVGKKTKKTWIYRCLRPSQAHWCLHTRRQTRRSAATAASAVRQTSVSA